MHKYRASTNELAQGVVDYALSRIRMDPPPLDGPRTADKLARTTGLTITEDGLGGAEALRIFGDVLAPATMSIDHPRFLSFVPAAPTEAAILADFIVSTSCIYGGSWLEGAGAVHAENEALRFLADEIGMPDSAGGVFVSGGTAGNLSALVAARDAAARDRGRPSGRWVVATSEEAHSSVKSAANVMDVEVLSVPTDENRRLSGRKLAASIDELTPEEREGLFAVVVTAGTTNLGIVDDIADVADVCEKHGLWLHVDGAYGGAAILVPEARHLFDGIEHVNKQLHRSFLAPMRNPEVAAASRKSAGGGLLLRGPPGCGKTFLARATAGEMSVNFYNVGLADILDMWIGASERNLASVFDAARRNAPCVLFFDEIDALGQKRSHLKNAAALRGVVNQLLSEMDGVSDNNDGVFVLAATNHPWDVDEALLLPGRFDRRLLVLPPDCPARRAILEFHLRDRPTESVDLSSIIEATEGWSGANVAFIVESAVEQCLDKSHDTGDIVAVTTAHLREALVEVPSTVGPWLEGARNHIMYSNRSGEYDALAAYLKNNGGSGRRPPGFRR